MCEFSEKLIALLDGELPPGEAIDAERHLEACAECRNRLRAYEQLSHCVDAYCDARLDASAPGAAVPEKSALLGAGAAAVVAVVAMLFIVPRVIHRVRDEQPPVVAAHAATPEVVLAATPRAIVRPAQKIHRHAAAALPQVQEADRVPPEPAIEIAIPADAVLPPGAVPEGVAFVAKVRIAADGSARQTFVWP